MTKNILPHFVSMNTINQKNFTRKILFTDNSLYKIETHDFHTRNYTKHAPIWRKSFH